MRQSGRNPEARPPESFGALLRRHRVAAGLSQEALAERAGLSPSAINLLERGARRAPYQATVRALADALGLAPADRATLEAAVSRSRQIDRPVRSDEPPLPRSSRLPEPLDEMVDRAEEIREIADLLRRPDVRLLTLTGPGGIGKTRLAIEVVRRLDARARGETVFVRLDRISDPALLLPTIGRALDLSLSDGRPTLLDALLARVADRDLLLVLDTCEHLAGGAPDLAALLELAPHLRVLATSRAPLRVRGEWRYPVGPLAAPERARPGRGMLGLDPLSPTELLRLPAVALLVRRAAAATPGFAVDAPAAAAIAAIAARLEGLPLAIELAAQEIAALTPASLLDRLTRDPRRLGLGLRDLPAHHRTLGDAFAWSYDLLATEERRLIRALSVLPGPFGVELAGLVLPPEEQDGAAPGMLERLIGLVDAGLLLTEAGPNGSTLFHLPGPYRPFALDRAAADGELEPLRDRLLEAGLGLAAAAQPGLAGASQRAWSERLGAARSGLEAALAWAIERGQVERGGELLWRLWRWLGRVGGSEWTERLLERAGELTPLTRARVLLVSGSLRVADGQLAPGRGELAESVALYRSADAQPELGRALAWQALAGLPDPGEAERRWLDESLAIGRRTGDPIAVGEALLFLGRILSASGEATAAEACYREGATLLEAVGDRATGALGLAWLGGHLLWRGDAAAARPVLEHGLAIGRELGALDLVARALALLGQAAGRLGDVEGAARQLAVGLSLARAEGDGQTVASCLEGLAWVAGERGRADRAEQLAAAAAALRAAAAPSIHEPSSQPGPPTSPPPGRPPTLARALEEAIAEATAPQSGARGAEATSAEATTPRRGVQSD